jgi:hypothetical protein
MKSDGLIMSETWSAEESFIRSRLDTHSGNWIAANIGETNTSIYIIPPGAALDKVETVAENRRMNRMNRELRLQR